MVVLLKLLTYGNQNHHPLVFSSDLDRGARPEEDDRGDRHDDGQSCGYHSETPGIGAPARPHRDVYLRAITTSNVASRYFGR